MINAKLLSMKIIIYTIWYWIRERWTDHWNKREAWQCIMRFIKYVKLEENCYQSSNVKTRNSWSWHAPSEKASFLKISFLEEYLTSNALWILNCRMSFPGGSNGKELACSAGDLRLSPAFGRSPEGGHGNPLQYSCLENPHGQRSLWATVQGHKKSHMTEQLSMAQIVEYDIWQMYSYLRNYWSKYGMNISITPKNLLVSLHNPLLTTLCPPSTPHDHWYAFCHFRLVCIF